MSEVSSETRDNNTRVAQVAVTQAGTYTCLAVNMYGNDRWVIHSLSVDEMVMLLLRSTVEVEMFTRTQVTGTGIGSQTVNSGEEVTLSCQVSSITCRRCSCMILEIEGVCTIKVVSLK